MTHQDLLLEIRTEELPPRLLQTLSMSLLEGIVKGLEQAGLSFGRTKTLATPRRLAVIIHELENQQKDYETTKLGPDRKIAFDKEGKPSTACLGFAKSCGVDVSYFLSPDDEKEERLIFREKHAGKKVEELLPSIIQHAISALPITKPMRWGNSDISFIRPVHSVILLYGEELISCEILGLATQRETIGHRFHRPGIITIKHARDYESQLENEGLVIVDFQKRKNRIENAIKQLAEKQQVTAIIEPELLDEVTGLVEYPIALFANFDRDFLKVPPEALMAAMRDHQKSFPVVDNDQQLLPHFITISNIQSQDPRRVISGNERVMRARLADAAFFYQLDQKHTLESHLTKLKTVTFQAHLGSLHDRALRLSQLTPIIASATQENTDYAARAGLLSPCDLVSEMVKEFPELQGIMAYYYAKQDGEPKEIAQALKEQYFPRFAKDALPSTRLGAVLALATRIDTLVGTFGMNQIPTGEKDPFALRRAALGIVRLIIDKQLSLDLLPVLEKSMATYGSLLINPDLLSQLQPFILERLRAYYLEQGIAVDVINAVFAKQSMDLLDTHYRLHAVNYFQELAEAHALASANKRVSNLLAKENSKNLSNGIDTSLFEFEAERDLASELDRKKAIVMPLFKEKKYQEALAELASLRVPVDRFFDDVMVIVNDEKIRHNRLTLLAHLRHLFMLVADISLLKTK